MILVLYIIIAIYCLAIIALIYGFTKVNSFDYLGLKPKTKFSIVVPFRNEAENLPLLLKSFSKLNYPNDLFEVILVDDASDLRFKINDLRFKLLLIGKGEQETYLKELQRLGDSLIIIEG